MTIVHKLAVKVILGYFSGCTGNITDVMQMQDHTYLYQVNLTCHGPHNPGIHDHNGVHHLIEWFRPRQLAPLE